MTTWNYRVVQTQTKDGPMWGIYEVYYDEDERPVFRTADPISITSDEGVEGVIWALQHALADVERGVLTDEDFNGSTGWAE